MKIAAVVILYHPTKDVISNIKTYYDWVEKMFVFDNTEAPSKIKDELLQFSKIEFYQNLHNEGIPKTLNQACELALQQQYDWILTMDQDSNFLPEAASSYFDCFNNYRSKENVAMFGTNKGRKIVISTTECKPKEVSDLITSGSLLNLFLFNAIGGFDEALFIDLVDNEYCARARTKGYSIILFGNIYLNHKLGTQVYNSSIKTLFLIKKKKEIHSPLRCYYMYRNMLYIENKYKDTNSNFARRVRKDVIARIKTNLLYGREISKTIKYLKAAKADFKNNKMGKKNC